MIYFSIEQIIDIINNNMEYQYKSILFKITVYMYKNRLFVKIVWNNKKESVKEIKQLIDIKRINDIIVSMITNKYKR